MLLITLRLFVLFTTPPSFYVQISIFPLFIAQFYIFLTCINQFDHFFLLSLLDSGLLSLFIYSKSFKDLLFFEFFIGIYFFYPPHAALPYNY